MTSHARRSSTRRKAKSHGPVRKPTNDAAVYLSLVMIGGFVVILAWLLLNETVHWTHVLVGYVIAIVVLINVYAWQAVFGKHQQGWQEALARVPLRIAGYGTKKGKPITAAKGQQDARTTLMLFGAGCVLLVALVTVLLVR